MILSDATIRKQMLQKRIIIDPEPTDDRLQPASVDLTLGTHFISPYGGPNAEFTHHDCVILMPGECLLATTAERIEMPPDLVARVEGKSSWGRKFLIVHATAGYVDPGFAGNITLELSNLAKVSQRIDIGSAIAQISFQWVDQPVTRPYGTPSLNSHYQGQVGATESALPWR